MKRVLMFLAGIAVLLPLAITLPPTRASAQIINPACGGSATLNWVPPTQNTNGTPLLDLAGYRIYVGTVSGSYPATIDVPNPGIATYVVDGLCDGTYYFVVSAYNAGSLESTFSNEATKTVTGFPLPPSVPENPTNLTAT